MPYADHTRLKSDDELGCDEEEGLEATERMRPHIQKLIERTREPADVLAALGTGFFDTLEQTGYPVARHSNFLEEVHQLLGKGEGDRVVLPKRLGKQPGQ